MFSCCIFLGLVSQEPEIHPTIEGHSAANFGLAVKSYAKTDPVFIYLAAYKDNIVEYVKNYIHKGDLIIIRSEIKANNYVNKDGKEVKAFKFEVDKIRKLRKQEKPENKPKPMAFFATTEEAENYILDDTEFLL